MQTFHIEQTGSQCVVTWRHFFSVCAGIVMFVGLLVCTFISWLCVELLLIEWNPVAIFFAFLFGASWFCILAMIVNSLFGKTWLILDENGLKSNWICFFFFKWKKQIELADIQQFEVKINRDEMDEATSIYSYSLRVVLHKNDVCLDVPAGKEELNNLCNQLNAFLETLKAESAGIE